MATQINSTQPGPNTNTGIGGNNPPSAQKQAWLDQCTAFGEAAGTGATSLVGWYQATVQAAFRDEIEPDFAVEGSLNYQKAQRSKKASMGKRATLNDGKADKVRESECRKMIKVGKLAQFRTINNGGLGVFNRSLKIIGDDVSLKGETSKHLLKVMTEQLRNPDAPLDDAHIKQVLSPKEGADKGEGDALYAVKKALEKVAASFGNDADKKAALASIQHRLDKVGFKTAKQKADEARAAAQLKAQKVATRKQAGAAGKAKPAVQAAA